MKTLPTMIQIQRRDKNVLLDLWRWKLLSLRAVHALHFTDVSLARCYNRMRQLARTNLVTSRSVEELNGRFWTLEKEGFELIQDALPEQRETGFKAEWPAHDAISSAVQLGIVTSPEGQELSFVSEQELRRLHPSVNPEWVPKTQLHRPDGYLRFGIGSNEKVCALEVELSLKSNDRYEGVGHFYSGRQEVYRVFWFVQSGSHARKLTSALTGSEPDGNSLHDFVLLSEFRKRGIGARVLLGPDHGRALSTVFGTNVTGDLAVTRPSHVTASSFFNGKISYRSQAFI